MKSKKGETVEVFSKRGEQAFSWWTAKIVSSQGASHMVSYNYKFDEDLGVNLEQVPAQAVRPYPPFIYKPTWVVGDIVEVFDDHSWKLAEIMKIVRSDYIVRFLGLEKERKVHWYDIRIRLSWENGEWLVIKQEFTTKRCTQMCADGCNKTISSHEEVAADELLKYSTTGIRYCHDVSAFSESNDRESVGSCDIDDSCAAGDEISSRINDVISSFQSDSCLCVGETSSEEIHNLKSRAYKRTLSSLYESGPISWDQEAFITDLRFTLGISNDEHLGEVKKLMSAEKSVCLR